MFDLTLLRWIVPYMRPYRWRLALLAVVSLAEVGLGALTPWTLKLVVDNVLSGRPMPGWIAAATSPIAADATALLGVILGAGLVLTITNEMVSVIHTQIRWTRGSGWFSTCARASSRTCRRSICGITTASALVMRSIASTSTPIASRTW